MPTETTSSNAGNGGTAKTVNHAVDKATTRTHDTIDRATRAARPAVDSMAEGAHDAVDRMAGAASHAAQRFDEKSEEFRHAQQESLNQLRAYVNEHPVAALSMAVAGGFLLSRILSSR